LKNISGAERQEPNPALGLRAIRYCLAEPQLFMTQLRALLRASHYGRVRILIPMLAHVAEIEQTLALIEQAKETLREQGVPFDSGITVGGMIEIPAAVLAISAFLAKLDFLSIGTNDLIQYTLAVDRSDDAVSHLYDPLHPAVLKLLTMSIVAANKAGVPIAVCGEMAGEPRLTRLLLGLGLRNLSMHPAHLLTVKQRVLTTNVAELRPVVDRIRRTDSAEKVVALLQKLNA
jgi:phosphotransferase system enzyme I (PtsI)